MPAQTKPLLLVDDDPTNQDLLSRRLTRAGYTTEVAGSGYEALDVLARREVELVLLDSMMPGMSGIDLLRRLRQRFSSATLPIIMVTALGESERIVEALNLGANDYISKPVDFPVALARIKAQIERKRAERVLLESEERYALAARGANDGLWDWNLETQRVYFSSRWKAMLGYEEAEIGEGPEEWLSRVHKEDRARLGATLAAHWNATAEKECAVEHRMLHKDGSYRWMLSRGVVKCDGQGKAARMAGSQTDITGSKTFDPLTGLPNRTQFHERLAACMDRAAQEPDYPFTVLCLDLDRFKVVNDSLGHTAGDELLVHVAQRLRSAVRSAPLPGEERGAFRDLIARLGGDEFAILLENVDSHGAIRIADRIRESIHAAFKLESREVFTTASIGIVPGHSAYRTPTEILRDADTAMYKAKSLGRSRFEVFEAGMRAQAVARLDLESDLRRAVDKGEFVLYYQPKVNLKTQQIVGVEALIRWLHPERGIVAPDEFIPLAEETGLIVPIGLWVLREACMAMRRWHAEFPTVPPLEVSVNVSVRQFREPDLQAQVAAILAETQLDPKTLQLEITESVLMDDLETVATLLDGLKTLGVGLKIDDFGTGYASLKCLNRLPFDVLKIDRSFVVHMSEKDGTGDTIRTILLLAENLGMQVVAEGIERKDQLEELQALHCDYGQGYYFSPPLEPEALGALIRKSREIAEKL
ncbi:MAG: EAL domain-containing protein [Bryobacteraceae bacterium]|jgi:diguanylate cyclase (GGDEF)-like protein/PAS domain S-box-containing protein